MNFKSLFVIGFVMCLTSCAGPFGPFGVTDQKTKNPPHEIEQIADLKIYPDYALFHKPLNITIRIPEKINVNDLKIKVYQGSVMFKKLNMKIKNNNIIFSNIELDPNMNGEFLFEITNNKNDLKWIKKWKLPKCDLNNIEDILSKHYNSYSSLVNKLAYDHNINPLLLHALIQQESSFNPYATSWAKAVGLSQITPIAATQIESLTQWSRSEELKNVPWSIYKLLIKRKQINDIQDWRLNPYKSIKAAAIYLNHIQNQHWSKGGRDLAGESSNTNLVLASYQSGPLRVKQAVENKGNDWLSSNDLKEARKYIRKIKSYCYEYKDTNKY